MVTTHSFCRDVREGQIIPLAGDLCSFLYEHVDVFDPAAPLDDGLCRGPYLLVVSCIHECVLMQIIISTFQIFRHLLTGPRTATNKNDGKMTGRAPKSDIMGVTEVTPRLIAYCATLVSTIPTSTSPFNHRHPGPIHSQLTNELEPNRRRVQRP